MPRKASGKPRKNHWNYEGRPTYNPQVEGYGNSAQWRGAFYQRMGFEEAERIKTEAGSAWRSEYKIIGEMAGVDLHDGAMWNEIKSAFRKAAVNCHPDRATQHGKTVEQATEEFKQVSAAYTLLAHRYGEN